MVSVKAKQGVHSTLSAGYASTDEPQQNRRCYGKTSVETVRP